MCYASADLLQQVGACLQRFREKASNVAEADAPPRSCKLEKLYRAKVRGSKKELTIASAGGRTCSIAAHPLTLVVDLKKKIEKLLNIPVQEQRLICNGNILPKEGVIAGCIAPEDTMITMVRVPSFLLTVAEARVLASLKVPISRAMPSIMAESSIAENQKQTSNAMSTFGTMVTMVVDPGSFS